MSLAIESTVDLEQRRAEVRPGEFNEELGIYVISKTARLVFCDIQVPEAGWRLETTI